ncbi:hypothetical protein R5R35_011611 [Gryllus longicercus]|uniref:Cytochrome P450 n=1 Tax=Gryllus longicercus TaxID=2509291 RepID=A0AAN9VLG9_9ORTH
MLETLISLLVNLLLVACGALVLLYVAGTWNYDFFSRRGIPSTRPRWPFAGDFLATFQGRSFVDVVGDLYARGRGQGLFGVFELSARPLLMVRDPELIKVIAVKEFDSFVNHRSFASEKNDPIMGRNLFNLKDQTWKDLRSTMSPAFTTSKIKTMMPLISQCAAQFTATLREKYLSSEEGALEKPLESNMKDVFTRLTNDMIATAAFGVTTDSLKDPDNDFYTQGQRVTNFNPTYLFAYFTFPKLAEFLGLRIMDEESSNFFHNLVHGTMSERQKRGIVRPDMLHMLMQAREGRLTVEKQDAAEDERARGSATKLTDNDITALSLIFFLGGLDTVSVALSFAAVVLAHHPDVQRRLQAEIDDVWEEADGPPTYEAVHKMKYLDAVVSEVLRMYPPAFATDRICQKDITLPAGAMSKPASIKKGTNVQFPIICLQNDPDYWSEPEKFDPERFNDENKHKIKPYTYIPFGLGPRLCIGQRFALLELKVALGHLLRGFALLPSPRTAFPVEWAVGGAGISPKGGFWCGLAPRAH